MTTTELIDFLKKYEFGGASGKPREISFCINEKIDIFDPEIKVICTGDGLIADICIGIYGKEVECDWGGNDEMDSRT